MAADLVHLLSTADVRTAAIACGSRTAQHASWDARVVTCGDCLGLQRPPQPPVGMTEKHWLAQVRAVAREGGWMTYHTMQSKGSEPGWVDLVCLKPPTLVLAELKTTQGRLTPHQQQWITALKKVTTVHTTVWRPEHWNTILQVLR